MSDAKTLRDFADQVRAIGRRVEAMESRVGSHRTVFAESGLRKAADELVELAKECEQQ